MHTALALLVTRLLASTPALCALEPGPACVQGKAWHSTVAWLQLTSFRLWPRSTLADAKLHAEQATERVCLFVCFLDAFRVVL
jgi:hypothetical protein